MLPSTSSNGACLQNNGLGFSKFIMPGLCDANFEGRALYLLLDWLVMFRRSRQTFRHTVFSSGLSLGAAGFTAKWKMTVQSWIIVHQLFCIPVLQWPWQHHPAVHSSTRSCLTKCEPRTWWQKGCGNGGGTSGGSSTAWLFSHSEHSEQSGIIFVRDVSKAIRYLAYPCSCRSAHPLLLCLLDIVFVKLCRTLDPALSLLCHRGLFSRALQRGRRGVLPPSWHHGTSKFPRQRDSLGIAVGSLK